MGKAGSDTLLARNYELACERFAALGVDVEAALRRLARVPLSLHCWQGDDIAGFEADATGLTGGIMATGNYPGRARTPEELRADLEMVWRLLPGRHRLALHALYAETEGKRVDRDALEPRHFQGWVDWAKRHEIGLDFNGSFFSHPKSADGFTLSHPDDGIRRFWIAHGIASRKIGAFLGRELGSPCVCNLWIPDGFKDTPVDRRAHRGRLRESLDEIFAAEMSRTHLLDAVEPKLFGLGSESCVIGSHEFYLAYAVAKRILLTLDTGHYHPTEVVSDKISAVLAFLDEILLHVSRGVRWDSDHVVTLNEELVALAQEIARGGDEARIHVGLDYFDASINRVAAWVIGARAMLKALLIAFLEPTEELRALEEKGDYTGRLAMLEDLKGLPYGAVWDHYCVASGTLPSMDWLDEVRCYEKKVLSKRR
ncbi:MAG: L-rhamnose isomerase [Verrucomicrobiae bacterium]|nr:L-rhamnose isomerase [Verrucomicrobiae bacterium]